MKNSAISPFKPKGEPIPPPDELGDHGRSLWLALTEEYAIEDAGGQASLLAACRAEDDIQRMRKAVAADGDTLTDRFGQRCAHPLHAAIRGAETVRRQALAALRLDVEPLGGPGKSGGK